MKLVIFDLDGKPYLPDFRLPDIRRYIEIKPDRALLEKGTCDKARLFSQIGHIVVFMGTPGEHLRINDFMNAFSAATALSLCHKCGHLLWASQRKGAEWFSFCSGCNYSGTDADPFCYSEFGDFVIPDRRIESAFNVARSARFEFGERG